MNTYTFRVTQDIQVKADSLEEAQSLLPEYGYSPNPSHYVYEETIELIKKVEK